MMGITHDGAFNNPELLIAVLNPSKTQIFIRYFTYPGLYTWGMIILLYVVAHKKKKGAWAVFVPALVTVLVCSVSPLACAMRYALPFVAAFPVLAGWTTVCDLEK